MAFASSNLADSLRDTLIGLNQNPYPHVECLETKRRASVALILRIRPHYEHRPESSLSCELGKDESPDGFLNRFFAQDWVQNGDAEVVFIKRAARPGDRWTSHVALPGGKRDPEDEDDQAVAIRETVEEIGLDLTSPHAFYVGNLPERVVSTSWGKVPIMVLCPYVFLWTQPDLPPLKLSPGEVASTHWVPLRVLLSPSSRDLEYVDVSDRFARRGGVLFKMILRSILGMMQFSAIRLIPSESLYCTSTPEFFSPPETTSQIGFSIKHRIYDWFSGDHAGSSNRSRPLLLWGLTLGMLADFLDQLPPHNAVQLWSYPTFTSRDVRWVINILTFSLKRRNQARLRQNTIQNQTAMDTDSEAVATGDNPWFIGGLSNGMEHPNRGTNATRSYAVGVLLDGYYNMARVGVWTAVSGRIIATVAFGLYIMKQYKLRLR